MSAQNFYISEKRLNFARKCVIISLAKARSKKNERRNTNEAVQ